MISHDEHQAHHRQEQQFSSFEEAMDHLIGMRISPSGLLAVVGIGISLLSVFIAYQI